MKNDLVKIILIFIITIGAVFFGLQYLFLGNNSVKTRASGDAIPLEFIPSTTTISTVNTDFEATVKIKPTTAISMRGYKLVVRFDNTKLKVKEIDYLAGTIATDLGDANVATDVASINNRGSIVYISQFNTETGATVAANDSLNLVKAKFTTLSTVGTTIETGLTTSNVYLIKTDGTLEEKDLAQAKLDVNGGGVIPTNGPTITPGDPTPTTEISGNVRLM